MITSAFCLSRQCLHCRAYVLNLWTEENLKEGKGGKEVILSKLLRPDPRASCFGGSRPAQHERHLLSKSHKRMEGLWAGTDVLRELVGGVGEKFEFLLNSVITTGFVTKRHFDNRRGWELPVASPWWLFVVMALIAINQPTDVCLQCFSLKRFMYKKKTKGGCMKRFMTSVWCPWLWLKKNKDWQSFSLQGISKQSFKGKKIILYNFK